MMVLIIGSYAVPMAVAVFQVVVDVVLFLIVLSCLYKYHALNQR